MPLTIVVPECEIYDRSDNTFKILFPKTSLTLEHSLLSLSKWESIWEKPYLSTDKTEEEALSYIKCMTLTKNVDVNVYYHLSEDNILAIKKYMDSPHHANRFQKDDNRDKNKEFITAETIYYQMITLGIYKECEKWNLNKLLALIKYCAIKNKPPKKMTKADAYKRNAAIRKANRSSFRGKL